MMTVWLTKLPQMVKQLEVSLYRSAPSFEAYSDTSTIKSRLQQLKMEIGKRAQLAKDVVEVGPVQVMDAIGNLIVTSEGWSQCPIMNVRKRQYSLELLHR
jgi:hypothetical protein